MTFKSLWLMIRTTWQSRPFAILLPLAALGWFFFTHGHDWKHPVASHSIPTWQEWMTLAALFATKGERLTEFLFGAPSPASLPAPVIDPVIAPKVGGLALLLGLSLFGVSGCSFFQKHVDAITTDISSCIGPNESADKADLKRAAGQFLEQVLMCDIEGGISPTNLALDLPACAKDALPGIEASLGPDGKAFVTCALAKIESDPNALAAVKARAKTARVGVERQQ